MKNVSEFTAFIDKWVCNNSLDMIGKQVSLHFQGLFCVAKFLTPEREYYFTIPLAELTEEDFAMSLYDLDISLSKLLDEKINNSEEEV